METGTRRRVAGTKVVSHGVEGVDAESNGEGRRERRQVKKIQKAKQASGEEGGKIKEPEEKNTSGRLKKRRIMQEKHRTQIRWNRLWKNDGKRAIRTSNVVIFFAKKEQE